MRQENRPCVLKISQKHIKPGDIEEGFFHQGQKRTMVREVQTIGCTGATDSGYGTSAAVYDGTVKEVQPTAQYGMYRINPSTYGAIMERAGGADDRTIREVQTTARYGRYRLLHGTGDTIYTAQ